eukprot:12249828-Ditylum_brightwellii.AAC.1
MAVNEVDQVLHFDFKEDDPAKRLAATELIGVLLQCDPQKRPKGFQEVLDHPFFQGYRAEARVVYEQISYSSRP